MPLTLQSRIEGSIPVDLTGITPCRLRESNAIDIAKQLVWCGRHRVELGELFSVDGSPADEQWHFSGELSAVHHLAANMQSGSIRVEGNVGPQTATGMRGGSVELAGNAGDWCGCELRGGSIRVAGNVGDFTGACYVGSKTGMRGGEIVVEGSAGKHAGEAMRRGMLTVLGDCGPWPGYRMRAGTLFLFGQAEDHIGAEMRRGTIGLFGVEAPTLLPTFRKACEITPVAISMLLKRLADRGYDAPRCVLGHPLQLANGDLLEGGRGEVYWIERN